MTAAGFAIELPTNRQSRYFNGPGPDVHDPNYIPVLNGADPRVDFSQPSFSALPSIPTPHQNESQTSLKRSKSAYAPETVVFNQNAHLPPKSFKTLSAFPQEIGSSHQPEGREDNISSGVSVDNTTSSSDADTTGPSISVLEEHIFMIPGNSIPRVEDIQFPVAQVPASARSSISSTKRANVPTSKYSKKSPTVPSLPSNAAHIAQTTSAARGASPEILSQQTMAAIKATPLPPTPIDSPPLMSSSIPRIQAAKSTASERRARALHSHPSNMSMKSRRNSTVEETDELPLISQSPAFPESRTSSTRSRTQSLVNSIQPTPAPDAPLPDLPSGARRPPTREKPIDKPFFSAGPSPLSGAQITKSQNDHVEMAEFMTTQRVTVFKRFDEIHVRLLLHLQDEITSLEKSLKEIEDSEPIRPDQILTKANILRDLRKVMAEYDHLFANWMAMQANKASPETKAELERWLQSPGLESGKISKSAMDDLYWLQNSRDLTSVSMDPEKRPLKVRSSDSLSKSSTVNRGTRGGGGGGFLAFFGCASKRK